MNYNWDIRAWIERTLPYFLRSTALVAWLYVLLKPLETLHGYFIITANDIDTKLRYNSQQKVFAAVLNNLFDNSARRIYVTTDSDYNPTAVVFSESESNATMVVFSESEPDATAIIYSDLEVEKAGYFTVHVPTSLSSKEAEISQWVKYYKLAGTEFTIKYF